MTLKPLALLAAAVLLAGCSTTFTSSDEAQEENRAVVIMSGGGAISPFTTPDQACSGEPGFLAAGNTDTALREYLLEMGKQVYTAPAMVPWGTVAEPDPNTFGPFKDCPIVLPESSEISIEIVAGRYVSANFDMQSLAELMLGDRITVQRSEHKVRFLHPAGWNYFDTLRKKMHWNEGV